VTESIAIERRAAMKVKKYPVDGNQTIVEQERALNLIEQTNFSKITSYAKNAGDAGSSKKLNEAKAENVPIGEQPAKLELEAIDEDDDPTPVIKKHEKNGQAVVFQDVAYVSGAVRKVLGFRQ
jgi:hypothetical protein